MTPEERAKMRERFASMTPEERAKMRKRWQRGRKTEDAGGEKKQRTWQAGRGGRRWGKQGGKDAGGCRVEKVVFDKGLENERMVEVVGGLRKGDRVVTLGQEDLQKGNIVRVVKLD
jgi:hypothetical protein